MKKKKKTLVGLFLTMFSGCCQMESKARIDYRKSDWRFAKILLDPFYLTSAILCQADRKSSYNTDPQLNPISNPGRFISPSFPQHNHHESYPTESPGAIKLKGPILGQYLLAA
jgi:hypothetical protein